MTNRDSNPTGYRLQLLEGARALAVEGSYDYAIGLVEMLLRAFPGDLDGLRLKGNVLEQKTLDLYEYRQEKLTRSKEYLLARQCYEQILSSDPQNTLALIDLGDHYKNLDAYDKAFSYYEAAVDIFRSEKNRLDRKQEIEELLATCLDLSRRDQTIAKAHLLKSACEELLK